MNSSTTVQFSSSQGSSNTWVKLEQEAVPFTNKSISHADLNQMFAGFEQSGVLTVAEAIRGVTKEIEADRPQLEASLTGEVKKGIRPGRLGTCPDCGAAIMYGGKIDSKFVEDASLRRVGRRCGWSRIVENGR